MFVVLSFVAMITYMGVSSSQSNTYTSGLEAVQDYAKEIIVDIEGRLY